MRAVFDTNVLIDGFQDDFSAQSRLLHAVEEGTVTAIVTPAIMKEYRLILRRLIQDQTYHNRVQQFLDAAEVTETAAVDVTIDDREDLKFLAAAKGGGAELIVTNDRHLLDIGEYDDIRIRTPQEAWRSFEDEQDGSGGWKAFAAGLGIGK